MMPASPILYLLGAAILASIFGDATSDIAGWIVCVASEGSCGSGAVKVAQMIATFISTTFSFVTAAVVGQRNDASEKETTGLIVGAMVGALFALLKAAEDEKGYPEPAAFVGPLIIFLAVAFLVFGPLVYVRVADRVSPQTAFRILARAGGALLAGLLLGGLYQWLAELVWRDPVTDGSSSKFVLAAVVPIAGTAAFGALIIPPTPWGNRGAYAWMALAVLLAALFFRGDYWSSHSDGWIGRAPISGVEIGIRYCLVVVSGILALGVVCLVAPGRPNALRTLAAILVAAGVAGWLVYGIGLVWMEPGVYRPGESLRLGTPVAMAMVQAGGTALGILFALAAEVLAEHLRHWMRSK